MNAIASIDVESENRGSPPRVRRCEIRNGDSTLNTLHPQHRQLTPNLALGADELLDIARMVAVTAAEGYALSTGDAVAIWLLYSKDLCAGWMALPDDEEVLLRLLLERATVREAPAVQFAPPDGYDSWLDYAVETMDTRSLEIEYLFAQQEGAPSRYQMRDAVRAELAALRNRSGA